MIQLESERGILRRFVQSDLQDFYEYAKNEKVGPMAGWPPHTCIEDSQKILDSFVKSNEVFAIVHKTDNKVIGSFGIHKDNCRNNENSCMIGYVLSVDYWGQGIIPEIVQVVLGYCFDELNKEIVSVYHFDFNKQSKRVIEKSGFKFEGILRKAHVLFNGKTVDLHAYSLLKEEYKQ